MDVAIRSYLTAGVAVVGATAITLAPIEVLPPDLQIRGDKLVAVLEDVSLSSLADLIAAAQSAIAPVGQGVQASAIAAGTAITQVGTAISEAVGAGVAGGGTAFRAVLDGLLAEGSTLATAVDNALAAFPTPEAFIDALVAAFATVDLNLSVALDVALQAVIDLGVDLNAAAIAEALLDAGGELAAAFNAAVANFPSPLEFSAAVAAALSGVLPGLSDLVTDGGVALANLITTLATTLASGIDLGGSAFDVLLAALQNGGSALAKAFTAAIASFANPEVFVDVFLDVLAAVNAPLAAAFETALDVALSLGFDLDVAAIVEALITTGGDLAAVLNLVLAGFPSPGDLIAAFGNALAGFLPGFADLASFAASAVANLSAALASAIQNGIALGGDVFGAIIDGLQNAGSTLYAAFTAALAAFPTPQAFLDAFVSAFAAISAPLGAALELAFDSFLAGLEIINPAAIAQALINAGAPLVDLFASVVASFPSPTELIAALGSALGGIIPGAAALAAAGVAAISNLSAALLDAIESGFGFGTDAFSAIINGLLDTGSALYATFAAAIAAFPTPEAFIDAFVSAFATISAPFAASLEVALNVFLDGVELLNPVAFAEALIEGGAELAASFAALLGNFPNPAELIAAFGDTLAGFIPNFDTIATAAAAAISNLSAAIADIVESGFGFGAGAFEALVNGITTVTGQLGDAFQAVLELFPSPELFVQALAGAFGEIGPVLANLGTALASGFQGSIELGAAALEALADISANIGASISASLSVALEGLPTPGDVVGAIGTVAESVVEATGYVGETVQAAVTNFTNVVSAVAVAFRETTATALANGQNSLEALVTGITAAAAQLASGFNFGVGVDVDVDVDAGVDAGTSASTLDVASTQGIGVGQMFSVAAPSATAAAKESATAETTTAATVTEDEVPATEVETTTPVTTRPVNPLATAVEDTQHTLNNAGKQIADGLDQTRKNIEGGLTGLRDNVEKAFGVKKPAADTKDSDSDSGSAGTESAKSDKTEKKASSSESKSSESKSSESKKSDSSAKSDKKSESKSDSKSSSSDSGE
ncbi:hypothetical protein BH11ACT7_BH11ACT7_16870 [soil metagenome]